MTDQVTTITHALIDPKWQVGSMKFADTNILFFSLAHPIHGNIISLVPKATAQQLIDLLTTTIANMEKPERTN